MTGRIVKLKSGLYGWQIFNGKRLVAQSYSTGDGITGGGYITRKKAYEHLVAYTKKLPVEVTIENIVVALK